MWAFESIYAGISVVVQWFRCLTPHAVAQVQSLVSGAKIPNATQPNKVLKLKRRKAKHKKAFALNAGQSEDRK